MEGFLVGEDVDLDSGPGTAEAGDGRDAFHAPVVGLFAIGQVACICAASCQSRVMIDLSSRMICDMEEWLSGLP